MNILKNCPTNEPVQLNSMIDLEPNQIISMAMSKSDKVHLSLFSFSDGEIVSEESYPGDTLYYLLEGATQISIGNKTLPLTAGEVYAVEAHRQHAIGGGQAFKMLQLTLLL